MNGLSPLFLLIMEGKMSRYPPKMSKMSNIPPKWAKMKGIRIFLLYIYIYIYGKNVSIAHPPKMGG